jgi:predicted helicase
VKRDLTVLVVLGNPPYNGHPGVAEDAEERALVEPYRQTSRVQSPDGRGLNDLYVRFFRIAERRIVEQTGRGVVCFISNYSWLDGTSFTGMRERFLREFDLIRIDNLHGDRRISEYAPDGRTSETVFAVEGDSVGIKVGTAISTLIKRQGNERRGTAVVHYRDFHQARAEERRQALIASLEEESWAAGYQEVHPSIPLALSLKPTHQADEHFTHPTIPELFPVAFPGVMTARDEFLVSIDEDRLHHRLQTYFSAEVSHQSMRAVSPVVMTDTGRFAAEAARDTLRRRGMMPQNVVRYDFRPLDTRWLYYEPETKLLDEKRGEYWPNVVAGNMTLVTQQKPRRDWSAPQIIRHIGCLDLMDRGATCIPVLLRDHVAEAANGDGQPITRPNLTARAEGYLEHVGATVADLFAHTLAILSSPGYAGENDAALRQGWPRVPLPRTGQAFASSASLGKRLVPLLDPETPVPGVTHGTPRPELRQLSVLDSRGTGPLNTALSAGWGGL